MIPLAEQKRALIAWVYHVTSLPAWFTGEPLEALPVNSVEISRGATPVEGRDASYVKEDNPGVASPRTRGDRLITYTFKVHRQSTNIGRDAYEVADFLRTVLRRPSSRAPLQRAALGLAEVGAVIPLDRKVGGRVESMAAFDAVFNTTSFDVDIEATTGYFEQIEVSGEVDDREFDQTIGGS